MKLFSILASFGAAYATAINSNAAADKITSLPGLDKLPDFDMYSGYLNITATKALHYWFVESQGNPASDPVVLWLNGGPGCSSMEGFMAEHGPLHLNDDSTISMNPWAWNMNANMIYLEAPVGVGFSKGSADDMKLISDATTAFDNNEALKVFFTDKFPQYLANGIFVSGESYAGIYVPTLIANIVDDDLLQPHFKGAIIGNGLYSWEKNQDSIVKFSKYHGLIDLRKWDKVIKNCCKNGNEFECDFFNYPNDECKSLVNQIVDQTWSSGLDVYNLYAECAGGISREHFVKHMYAQSDLTYPKKQLRGNPTCTNGTALTDYFNSAAVKSAIHVDSSITWTLCADNLNYQTTVQDVSQYLHHALNQAPDSRLALYAGDVDMACNFLGGEMFAEAMGLSLMEDYQAWNYMAADNTKQIGGYLKKFDRLSWVTVKGAGHMVPTDKPIQAFTMFSNFLNGKI